MAQRIIDLSLLIEDNMPARKLFQRPVVTTHLSHAQSRQLGLGITGDAMTFQTNFLAMIDHVVLSAFAPNRGMVTASLLT